MHELKENNTGCMGAHDARQYDVINRNNMVGQSFTEQTQQPTSKENGSGLQYESSSHLF